LEGQIATRQDLGLADAYVDGDFTCVDEQDGLLSFLRIMIANRDINRLSAGQSFQNRRGWTRPLLLTSAMDSAISYLRHLLRSNTLTNSRRNISQHYDLVQIFFSLPFCCCQMDILHHSDMRKCHFFVVLLWVSTHIFCKTELEPRNPEITNIECVSVESWQKSSVYFDCKLLCHYGRVVILSNSQVQEVVLIRVIELCVYSKLK
jgi:hypothetical protein